MGEEALARLSGLLRRQLLGGGAEGRDERLRELLLRERRFRGARGATAIRTGCETAKRTMRSMRSAGEPLRLSCSKMADATWSSLGSSAERARRSSVESELIANGEGRIQSLVLSLLADASLSMSCLRPEARNKLGSAGTTTVAGLWTVVWRFSQNLAEDEKPP